MIEVDVHLTKDGVPVVVHDDTLERCSNVAMIYPDRAPWRVADFTLGEIMSLDAGSWFVRTDPFGQIAAGNVPPEDVATFVSGHVRIPTLRAVLMMVQQQKCLINIEIKNFPAFYPEIASKVVAEVRRAGVGDSVIFSSFDHEILMELKEIAPEIPRAALAGQPIYPLTPYLNETLGVVAYNPGLEVLGFQSVDYREKGAFKKDIIRQAYDAGMAVFVWTVNDPKIMRELIDAGAAGIFTDFPQLLAEILKEKN